MLDNISDSPNIFRNSQKQAAAATKDQEGPRTQDTQMQLSGSKTIKSENLQLQSLQQMYNLRTIKREK